MANFEQPQMFRTGMVLAVGLVLSSFILAWGLRSIRAGEHAVVVTGSAKKRIKSDLIVWRTALRADASQLSEAFRTLTRDVPKVKVYLVSKGIPENEIIISAIQTVTVRERRARSALDQAEGVAEEPAGRITGYSLRQELQVRSGEVEKITAISRQVTELINQGMLIESIPPEYLYTKLGDLKVEMLAEAARDAKTRAEQIASATGNRIGPLRAARMGVLQITPADSNVVSDYGVNDTTSLEKDITAVVNITFAVE